MKDWLEEYFQEPNQWDLNKILDTGYNENIQKPLQEMLSPALSGSLPLILPRLDVNQQLSFYLVGNGVEQLNELRGIITAYVGKTYITLDQVVHHKSSDPLEIIVLKHFTDGFLRLHIHKSINNNKRVIYWIIAKLNKIIRQIHERPKVLSTVKRPTGRILRDYFIAYNHHDYDSMVCFYEELENNQLLSKRNLISLELQALSAGNRWNALLGHPRLPDILAGQIPRRIVMLVLRALHISSLDPENLQKYKIDDVRKKYVQLDTLFFRTPDIPKSIDYNNEWKCWAIGAAAFGYSHVLDVLPDSIEAAWKHELAKWASINVQQKHSPNLEQSIDSLLLMPASLETAVELLKESITANIEEGMKIYNWLDDLPDSIKSEVLKIDIIHQIWSGLENKHGDTYLISSWPALFTYLSAGAECPDLIKTVVDQSDYWISDDWDEEPLLDYISGQNNDDPTLRNVLPILLSWLNRNELTLSVDSIEQILTNLATDSYISTQDLYLSIDLMALLIESPHTKSNYETAIDVFELCWDKIKSHGSVDAGLEVIDFLIDAPCANPDHRLRLWLLLQEFLIKDWLRLDNRQKLSIEQFSEELTGATDHLPIEKSAEIDAEYETTINLTGKKLAIYTLTEGSGRRAKSILEKMYSGFNISLNHDKTATSALKNLAKSVDYFIFSSRSAAHQAFYPVTTIRSDIIYPSGKGSSSIIQAFISFINSNDNHNA